MNEPPLYSLQPVAASVEPPRPSAFDDDFITPPIGMRPPRSLDHEPLPERRVLVPLLLFGATCASTFFTGAVGWNFADAGPAAALLNPRQSLELVTANRILGLEYMAAVIGILLMHEMGHFLQAVRYRIPASWPWFIPMPLIITGTMGAVIGMQGSRADRKQLFDIGLSGPWAGLVAAVPIIWIGILTATAAPADPGAWRLNDPLIFKLLTWFLRPDLPAGFVLDKNPLLMAGWVGMLITGLNMMPVSQLDGGHVLYSLFGARGHLIARAFVMGSIAVMVISDNYQWVVMLVLVLLMGVDHPPTRDDQTPLGWPRRVIGFVSLFLPVLCFTPKIIA